MRFFEELKRRNVFRVGIAYAVVGWLIMQVTDTFAPALRLPEWFPSAVAFLLMIGLPIALFFAWAFELTPEGIKRDSEIDPSQSVALQNARKLDRMIIIALVAVIGVLLVNRYMGIQTTEHVEPAMVESSPAESPAISVSDRSIAVLPFVNMSADPDNEYFSDGIAEEILNVLARIPQLKVAARTSAFAYKETDINIAEIAKDLKVATVLEGSVRKDGNQVRVTAQLIKADDGYHLWSSTFDRELTNIFAIQDEIANSIASALKVTLHIETSASGNFTGTNDIAAYDAYLRGTNQWHLRTAKSLYHAVELFKQSIAHDPRFARAYAGLALTYAVIADYTDFPVSEAQAMNREAANAALAIDPTLIEAATALIQSSSDFSEKMVYARRAIAMDASFPTTHQWFGTMLGITGDKEASLAEYEKAFKMDPRSRVINVTYAYGLHAAGRAEEADQILSQVLSWAPEYSSAWVVNLYTAIYRNDRSSVEDTLRALSRIHKRDPKSVDLYMDMIFEPSKRQFAISELRKWARGDWSESGNPSLIRQHHLTYVLALLDEKDVPLEMLKDLIRTEPPELWGFLRSDRMIPKFACDPEVQAFFADTPLPPMTVPYPCQDLLQ